MLDRRMHDMKSDDDDDDDDDIGVAFQWNCGKNKKSCPCVSTSQCWPMTARALWYYLIQVPRLNSEATSRVYQRDLCFYIVLR